MEFTGVLFLVILPVVAYLYASVGHGGASGYLALMALFGISPVFMRPSAWVLNLFVAGIAFYQYQKGGYFRWQLLLPFIIASIPLAAVGGSITIDPVWYKRILGICLVIATLRILGVFGVSTKRRKLPLSGGLVMGGLIGLFSGMIGIGGGIILSPVILLAGWGNVKETAAVSAVFILLNSVSGLISQSLTTGVTFHPYLPIWIIVALAGGYLGGYSGSIRFNRVFVRNALAVVLLLASVKLFLV